MKTERFQIITAQFKEIPMGAAKLKMIMGQGSIGSKVSGSPREPLPMLKVPVHLVCLSLTRS